jgi:uncharacterized protein YndB with AHSA1/START domain
MSTIATTDAGQWTRNPDTMTQGQSEKTRTEGLHVNNPTTITAEPGLPFIDIVREFDAPASAVFRAHTDPDLFRQWIGPRGMQLESLELDATTGGRWKYVFRCGSDVPCSFHGVFHTVEPNTLIIQTAEVNMAPGQVATSTTVFAEVNGRTRLSSHDVYPSVEARDAALGSGMEYGVNEGYQKLDALLSQ